MANFHDLRISKPCIIQDIRLCFHSCPSLEKHKKPMPPGFFSRFVDFDFDRLNDLSKHQWAINLEDGHIIEMCKDMGLPSRKKRKSKARLAHGESAEYMRSTCPRLKQSPKVEPPDVVAHCEELKI